MMQPNPNQVFVDIQAGATTSAGQLTLGKYNEEDRNDKYKLRKLRVVPLNDWTVQLSCMLILPGGINLGPIDLPMALNVELPVQIIVTCPAPEPIKQTIMCTIADLHDAPNLYGATRLERPRQGVDTRIPDACVALTAMTGGVLTFKDAVASVIGTMGGTALIPRPRLAKTVATSVANSAIIFHY